MPTHKNFNMEIKAVIKDLKTIEKIYHKLITILPSFNITDKNILPYGLKPHTRSVSWIVEQVVTQQTKYRASQIGVDSVNIDMPDTCLHDCEIRIGKKIYYVNVKISNADKKKENKNDIAAVEKLYMQYITNKSYDLIYACFGIFFRNINIRFSPDYLYVFSPQFLPIYVNPRNDKIQAFYNHEPIHRSRVEFLSLLRENSKSIVLKAKGKKA